MASAQYNALTTRIADLKARFLNFTIAPDALPTQHELDMIASFKLLAHAEFEHFIEERIKRALEESKKRWFNDRKVTRCLFNATLAAFPHFEKYKNPFYNGSSKSAVDDLVDRSTREAMQVIVENNGIKETAFNRLCYLGGLLIDDISGTLVASMDSYGTERGDVAHKPVLRVRSLKDPQIEASEAEGILKLLEKFDDDITASLAI